MGEEASKSKGQVILPSTKPPSLPQGRAEEGRRAKTDEGSTAEEELQRPATAAAQEANGGKQDERGAECEEEAEEFCDDS